MCISWHGGGKTESNLGELPLSFHLVNQGNETQVARLGVKCLYLLSHLSSPLKVQRTSAWMIQFGHPALTILWNVMCCYSSSHYTVCDNLVICWICLMGKYWFSLLKWTFPLKSSSSISPFLLLGVKPRASPYLPPGCITSPCPLKFSSFSSCLEGRLEVAAISKRRMTVKQVLSIWLECLLR